MNALVKKFENTRILLGTNSPRRQELLRQLGLTFEILVREVDESFPDQFKREDIAMFLARKKSLAYKGDVAGGGLVITGVCIMSAMKSESFFVKTEVSFKNLRDHEIEYYLDNFNPLDKAGAYGIQEWIGLTGVEYIIGSYYNVVGLPTKELYENLLRF